MTHTALVNAALIGSLAVMTLLLVMFILAVIVSPSQAPSPHAVHSRQDGAPSLPPPPAQPPATTPAPLLLRRQPPVTAPAGFNGWPVPHPETTELGAPLPLMHDRIPQPEVSGKPPWELPIHDRIPRPEVSGSPPWGPAPKPPGMDG
jgi:hypothetical protein